jgi:hypothetical protein
MTRKMKKKNEEFDQIDMLKERYQQRIEEQELKIKASFTELSDNLTGATLINKFKENLFTGSGFAFKLGFMAVTLLQKKLSQRKRKRA